MIIKIVLVLTFAALSNGVYNTEIFQLGPKSERRVQVKSDHWYTVYNVGKAPIKTQLMFYDDDEYEGDGWLPLDSVFKVEPKQFEDLFTRRKEYLMAIRLVNEENVTAYVHASSVTYGYADSTAVTKPSSFNFDGSGFLKTVLSCGAARVPLIGNELAALVSFFWPQNEENIWNEVEDQVNQAIDKKAKELINAFLENELNTLKDKIQNIASEIDDLNITETSSHFMSIAQNMIGYEKKFVFKGNIQSNFVLLPMYSTLINLKFKFYQYGYINQKKINLTKQKAKLLVKYIYGDLYTRGVEDHIKKVCTDELNKQYNDGDPTILHDQLLFIHAYCALNGYEHLNEWRFLAVRPDDISKHECADTVPSTIYGRPTALLTGFIVRGVWDAPYKPKLSSITKKLKKIKKIKVYIYEKNDPGIMGLDVHYEDDEVAFTGLEDKRPFETVEFNNRKLMNLTAYGKGEINGLRFGFDDGREQQVGYMLKDNRTFSLEDHHIVGFYMTGSIKVAVCANIGVMYQVIVK